MKTTLADRVATDDKSIRSVIDVDIADLYTKVSCAIRFHINTRDRPRFITAILR